ncbi:MAG: cell division protein FtsZ [Pseudomonadota bacterium]
MSIKLQLPKLTDLRPRLTVIGVGGAGCNAINNMIAAGLTGVEFVVANTDAQALAASSAERRVQLGVNLTEGLGAGSKPEIGEAAAEEAIDDIRSQIAGSHMVFIAAGMGGGTGTGAASVVARAARELGILTVAVVTKPFQFEGARRMRIAEVGLAALRPHVDTLIVIPNQNLFRIANERTTFAEAFVLADQVLYSGVACVVDLIMKDGLINLDFADVRTIMSGMGTAMMGTGEGEGERRAILAAEEAIANPLLDDVSLRGARGLLLSITGGHSMTLYEVDEAASRVREEVDPEANIIVGATFDESLGDRVRVSIVASGMSRAEAAAEQRRATASAPPHSHASDADALGRRISQAMSAGSDPVDPEPRAETSAGRAGEGRDVWQAPGDVQIESGLPPALAHRHATPERSRAADVPPPVEGHYTPQAPAEIRRTQRRIPDIEDFPIVGQREYRAKTQDDRQPTPPAPPPLPRGPAGEATRPGLFQRLAGLGRRHGDSDSATPQVNKSARAEVGYSAPQSRERAPTDDHHTASRATSEDRKQAVGLPVFFGREKK